MLGNAIFPGIYNAHIRIISCPVQSAKHLAQDNHIITSDRFLELLSKFGNDSGCMKEEPPGFSHGEDVRISGTFSIRIALGLILSTILKNASHK
jgi:hypothetical protein